MAPPDAAPLLAAPPEALLLAAALDGLADTFELDAAALLDAAGALLDGVELDDVAVDDDPPQAASSIAAAAMVAASRPVADRFPRGPNMLTPFVYAPAAAVIAAARTSGLLSNQRRRSGEGSA